MALREVGRLPALGGGVAPEVLSEEGVALVLRAEESAGYALEDGRLLWRREAWGGARRPCGGGDRAIVLDPGRALFDESDGRRLDLSFGERPHQVLVARPQCPASEDCIVLKDEAGVGDVFAVSARAVVEAADGAAEVPLDRVPRLWTLPGVRWLERAFHGRAVLACDLGIVDLATGAVLVADSTLECLAGTCPRLVGWVRRAEDRLPTIYGPG